MITNAAFMLDDDELARYNEWAGKISRGMGEAGIESWTLNVTFSFSNLGTDIIAYCGGADPADGLVIRNGFEMM